MSIISRMRRQKAVFWSRTGVDGYGQPVYGSPVEIACRWDDEQREFIKADGTVGTSRSIAYVDRDMKPGDKLKLGEYTTDFEDDVTQHSDAFEIQAFVKNPNLKATEFLRTAIM